MNRQIAAWTIAAVAVLGLTACSGTPSASEGSQESSSSEAPAENKNDNTGDQSVADACAAANAQVAEASSTLAGLDIEAATADPQGTVDAFTETVDAIGAAADSVNNAEVKEAVTALYEDFGQMRDVLSAVLIDQDMSVASEMTTITTDITESSTALSTLCAG
ncbi:hypothetical protein [Microbacterium sp. NPDC056234]|uniref:hypothetical protein n=1 Tax=Microbacterium sp. NPDC056234 TaxID=3345757 RepID=UPI0035D886D8